jgi:hypothetical protein
MTWELQQMNLLVGGEFFIQIIVLYIELMRWYYQCNMGCAHDRHEGVQVAKVAS